MSVKVSSKEMLDSNAYNRIIIRGVKGEYFVKVSGYKKDDMFVSVSYKLSDSFKRKGDNEKILSIIESFLANSKVKSIELEAYCAGCKGQFIKVSGDRELLLQIDDALLLSDVLTIIKRKYDKDRYEYCINDGEQSYSVVLSKNVTSYGRVCISCENCEYHGDCIPVCPGVTQFRVWYEHGKIVSFDKKFLARFVYDKLWEQGVRASIVEATHDIKVGGVTKIGEATDGYYIVSGNFEILFNCSTFSRAYVYDFCNSIVNRYNKELNKIDNSVKKRQLKMEGF